MTATFMGEMRSLSANQISRRLMIERTMVSPIPIPFRVSLREEFVIRDGLRRLA